MSWCFHRWAQIGKPEWIPDPQNCVHVDEKILVIHLHCTKCHTERTVDYWNDFFG